MKKQKRFSCHCGLIFKSEIKYKSHRKSCKRGEKHRQTLMFGNPKSFKEVIYLGRITEIALMDGRVISFLGNGWGKKPCMLTVTNHLDTLIICDVKKKQKATKKPSAKAARIFKEFNMKHGVKNEMVTIPDIDKAEKIGLVKWVIYLSDKERTSYGNDQEYIHRTKSPHPKIYKGKDIYIIKGGKMRCRGAWLYD